MQFAADIQTDTLGRSLIIALLIVSPYGIYKLREVRALRRQREAEAALADAPPPPLRPGLEAVIERISELDEPSTVLIPSDVSVAGSDPPPGLVDALVRDALRRSGLVIAAEVDTAEGRLLEVRPGPS